MPEKPRRLILANGEQYLVNIEKPGNSRPGELPRTYEEARELVKRQLAASMETFTSLPVRKRYDDEAVFCLRLHPDRMAKTYDPKGLFATVRDLENVGSRNYKVSARDVAQTKRIKKQLESNIEEVTGRLVFVRSNDAGFKRLLRILDQPESALPDLFRTDVRSIERFDLLSPTEQIQFPKDWNGGRVELVLHPTQHSQAEQMEFLRGLCGKKNAPKFRAAPYPNGPTFISCILTQEALNEVTNANPLRSAHPLVFGGLEDLRAAPHFPSPPPPLTDKPSTIRVGIFDGGIDISLPHLRHHAEQDEQLSIDAPPNEHCIAHGTAVAGAVLYGPLNDRASKEPLPTPRVSVVSVRTLPTSSHSDPDLYECIDVIENAVPARNDVKFWNISFGPRGPIMDDSISRFTYALDMLAVEHKVGFCVAVGNDGDAGKELNRIQAPSDLVNGMGVGAHTILKNAITLTSYSCHGPGRECGKVKPDVTAFGGCELNPIHLLSAKAHQKVLLQGTSFASPQVASLAGQAFGYIDRASPLLARALVVHTARHPENKPDNQLGHGVVAPNFDEIVQCDTNHVSVVFQGSLPPRRHVKLPIMLPEGVLTSGMVTLSWTIVCLPPVNASHPSDYTSLCIEDIFYPDSLVHRYAPPKTLIGVKEKILHLKRDAIEVRRLLAENWKRSLLPVTASPKYRTEDQQRAAEQKWEPIVKRVVKKRADSLNAPFLVLHAIPRHGVGDHLDFAAVVSISAPKFSGDLYDLTLRKYPALQPIRLRAEAELRVQVQ